MRVCGIKRCLLLLVCFTIGFLGLIVSDHFGMRQPATLNGGRQDFRFPGNVQDDDTNHLMGFLQQKLKDLSDFGFLLKMGQPETCRQGDLSFCIDPICNGSLPPRLSVENIVSVRKPVKEVGMDRLREVIKAFDVTSERKKYVIVTGASSNHFYETQSSLKSLYEHVLPHLTNFSLIFYDLGLTDEQRQQVWKYPGIEIKMFPFEKLPARFKHLFCYLWKPLIILAHLQSSEFLLWMDSSINYFGDIRSYFNNVSKTGILVNRAGLPFPQHVYLKMFEYFGDHACQFSAYDETEGGFLVLHNEPFTRHLIIEPWSACALDPNCMCPNETQRMIKCPQHIQKYGKCHRYDQATIGYILIKLFREYRDSVTLRTKFHFVKR